MIIWQQHPSSQKCWIASIGDRTLYLRMNNFPEEPMYTLISSAMIEDFDDLPDKWILE